MQPTQAAAAVCGSQHTRLDTSGLDRTVQSLFVSGLATSTQRTYSSGQHRYLRFCDATGMQALPAGEDVLCRFVAQLSQDGLKHCTIKTYMASIRHLQIERGLDDPFAPSLCKLHYVLRGVKRTQAADGGSSRKRLPITPTLLRAIKGAWDKSCADPDTVMLWAAGCLAFFGFMRTGELTVPSDQGYDSTVHLSLSDISVDNPADPGILGVRQGISLFIGRVSSDICPVAAMLAYLMVRGPQAGPLFKYQNGRFLTRQRLVVAVRDALRSAGVQPDLYSGHSFRIGAATTAASRSMDDSIVMTLGRWRSLVYLEYIKIPRQQLARYFTMLC